MTNYCYYKLSWMKTKQHNKDKNPTREKFKCLITFDFDFDPFIFEKKTNTIKFTFFLAFRFIVD